MNEKRTPEEYLDEMRKAKGATPTIYVGFAAGKTYKMLAGARQLKNAGGDVVCGYIETHGRERTGP